MKKVYLATPYSHMNPDVQQARFAAVNAVAARMMADGLLVFSPISHTHPIALAGNLPKGWDYWQQYDLTFIRWADEVHVLLLDGWAESVGVTAEIALAESLGKPVRYINPESRDTLTVASVPPIDGGLFGE